MSIYPPDGYFIYSLPQITYHFLCKVFPDILQAAIITVSVQSLCAFPALHSSHFTLPFVYLSEQDWMPKTMPCYFLSLHHVSQWIAHRKFPIQVKLLYPTSHVFNKNVYVVSWWEKGIKYWIKIVSQNRIKGCSGPWYRWLQRILLHQMY